jgi:VanZ family protein
VAAWLPPVIWLGFILVASTDLFSAAQTGGVLKALLRWLLPDADSLTIHFIHVYVRKAAHVVLYGILGVLLFRALRDGRAQPARERWRMSWAVLAVLMGLGAAALDEALQTTQQARSGRVGDVLLDGLGLVVAQLALYFYWRRRGAAESARGPEQET